MIDIVVDNMIFILLGLTAVVEFFEDKDLSFEKKFVKRIALIVVCIILVISSVALVKVDKQSCKFSTKGVITKVNTEKDYKKGEKYYYIEALFKINGKDYKSKGYTYEKDGKEGARIVIHYNSNNPKRNYAGDISNAEGQIHDMNFIINVIYIIILSGNTYYAYVAHGSRKYFGMEV